MGIKKYEIFHNHPERSSGRPSFLPTPDLRFVTAASIRERSKYNASFEVSITAIFSPKGFNKLPGVTHLLNSGFIGERYTSGIMLPLRMGLSFMMNMRAGINIRALNYCMRAILERTLHLPFLIGAQ